MRATIREFRGLEHRLEPVATIGRVLFVNDSKATTVDATIKALESFDRPIVLILGGKDKGADFTLLRRPVRKRVRKALLVGSSAEKIRAALEGVVPLEKAATFRELVRKGYEAASPGRRRPARSGRDVLGHVRQLRAAGAGLQARGPEPRPQGRGEIGETEWTPTGDTASTSP